jgi:hypothetical protein
LGGTVQILQLLDGKGIVQFYNVDILGCYLSFRHRHPDGFRGEGRIEAGTRGVNALAASHGRAATFLAHMMLIGIAGLGFVAYQRKSKPALIAA